MTNEEITKALLQIAPDAQWRLQGDDYSDIEWYSETKKPTLTQIKNAITDLSNAEQQKQILKQAVLDKLGITEAELRAVLG